MPASRCSGIIGNSTNRQRDKFPPAALKSPLPMITTPSAGISTEGVVLFFRSTGMTSGKGRRFPALSCRSPVAEENTTT